MDSLSVVNAADGLFSLFFLLFFEDKLDLLFVKRASMGPGTQNSKYDRLEIINTKSSVAKFLYQDVPQIGKIFESQNREMCHGFIFTPAFVFADSLFRRLVVCETLSDGLLKLFSWFLRIGELQSQRQILKQRLKSLFPRSFLFFMSEGHLHARSL